MVEISRGPGVTGWNPDSNLPQGVVSPSEHRMGISALALYAGVFMDSADSASVSTSTSSRDLSIAPARVAIKAPLGGYYTPSWQSPVTLTPAVAGSQARIDTIAVRQSDYELDPAATTSLAELILVQGTASATPSPPSLGDGVLGLADVRIPAGSTTSSQYTITRRAQWTTPVGGSPHFDTEAARNATLPKPVAGQECTTGSGASLVIWTYTGAAWVATGGGRSQSALTNIGGGWDRTTAIVEKVGSGVHFVGQIGGTGPIPGYSAYTSGVATVPSGYRPIEPVYSIASSSVIGTSVIYGRPIGITIQTDGTIQCYNPYDQAVTYAYADSFWYTA